MENNGLEEDLLTFANCASHIGLLLLRGHSDTSSERPTMDLYYVDFRGLFCLGVRLWFSVQENAYQRRLPFRAQFSWGNALHCLLWDSAQPKYHSPNLARLDNLPLCLIFHKHRSSCRSFHQHVDYLDCP